MEDPWQLVDLRQIVLVFQGCYYVFRLLSLCLDFLDERIDILRLFELVQMNLELTGFSIEVF